MQGICECCRQYKYVEMHHVFEGTGHRPIADKYKDIFVVPLCRDCHFKIHNTIELKEFELELKKIKQLEFDKKYGDGKFLKLFRRNYVI